jgi:hypothetical protein
MVRGLWLFGAEDFFNWSGAPGPFGTILFMGAVAFPREIRCPGFDVIGGMQDDGERGKCD